MKKRNLSSKVFIYFLIIYLLIPLVMTAIYSMFEKWTGILPETFTLDNYVKILSDKEFLSAMFRTIIVCIITISMVLLALFVTTVYFPKLEKYIQIICMIPYMIQGVILSVSIISLYSGSATFLSNRMFMLNGAYCILILPFIYQGIRNSMRAINMPMLLEAAEMLGASKLYAFFRVVVSNIIPGITVSALLSTGMIFGDYILVRNIAGSSYKNIQSYLYFVMKRSSTEASAVFVLIMITTFIITFTVLQIQKKETMKKQTEKR